LAVDRFEQAEDFRFRTDIGLHGDGASTTAFDRANNFSVFLVSLQG
jgi:hypothetical protein